jgi:cyclopropane fatty-acyl-phospholipid synthase-like methyltransferase
MEKQMSQRCRICKGGNLIEFLDLGIQPHCNSFLREDQLKDPEPKYPLKMMFCPDCKLAQLSYVVDADIMFKDYLYVSGTTRTLSEHFRCSAEKLTQKFSLKPDSLVVDIGSNDGTFLKHFQDLGMRTVGVEPADNIAEIAAKNGVETVNDYFSEKTAQKIRAEKGAASLITAAGVFFHIDDMDDVCRGIYELLADDGVLHVQAIYLGDVLKQNSFDNIYHEHLSLYTVTPLTELFSRFGMTIFDLEHSDIHGGTMLYYVCREGARPINESVEKQLEYERSMGWDKLQAYEEFAERVHSIRKELKNILTDLKSQGKRIAAYTAPAKGNTLLNFCEIGPETLECAAERAPLKIGLFTPGTNIPVMDEDEVMKNPPDYFLLLAWNFKDELLQKNQAFRDKGGKFIIPIPYPHIV